MCAVQVTLPTLIFSPLNLFSPFGQTVHLKKKMEGKSCILKDFFLCNEPSCTQKGQNCIHFGLSECNRVKNKNNGAVK